MYTTYFDERIVRDVEKLSNPDKARIDRIREIFEEKGFLLSNLYLKKLSKNIWELRSGSIRLLFGVVGKRAIIVRFSKKKTRKTPVRDIRLSEKRFREFL